MALRTWRYSGSLAVMISELVLGSAWMKPPVLGCGEAATGLVVCGELLLVPPVLLAPVFAVLDVWVLPSGVLPMLLLPPPPPPAVGKAARSTVASFTASAFFR